MNRANKKFYVMVPVVDRGQIAEYINQHSKDNAGEQPHIEGALPVLDRVMVADDERLTDELCQGFAESHLAACALTNEDVRVVTWSAYLDNLILMINSMDVIAGGTRDADILLG